MERGARNFLQSTAVGRKNTDQLRVALLGDEKIQAAGPRGQSQRIRAGLVQLHRAVVGQGPIGIHGKSRDLV